MRSREAARGGGKHKSLLAKNWPALVSPKWSWLLKTVQQCARWVRRPQQSISVSMEMLPRMCTRTAGAAAHRRVLRGGRLRAPLELHVEDVRRPQGSALGSARMRSQPLAQTHDKYSSTPCDGGSKRAFGKTISWTRVCILMLRLRFRRRVLAALCVATQPTADLTKDFKVQTVLIPA